MPNLERRLNQEGGFQSTYISEVRGKCYHVPAWLIKLCKYPVPHAMKRENFLSYEDLLMKKAFVFITFEHYMPSQQGKISKTGSKDGQDMDRQVKKTFDGIFNQQNVAMVSECHLCGKPRCIFTLSRGEDKRNNVKATHRYLNNTMPLQCGMPLFAVDPDIFFVGK
jgi:hypothetical protein